MNSGGWVGFAGYREVRPIQGASRMKKLTVELTCPKCEAVFRQVLEDMSPGVTRRCPHCGVDIQFAGDDGHEVQRAVDKLEQTFKDLSRRLGR